MLEVEAWATEKVAREGAVRARAARVIEVEVRAAEKAGAVADEAFFTTEYPGPQPRMRAAVVFITFSGRVVVG